MTNTEAWESVAARAESRPSPPVDTVLYGPDVPTERDLRLLGDVSGTRVLELGCGMGQAAIALALRGAHAIAVDLSPAMLERGRRLAEAVEARVEWHHGDLADLAFLRAESIDIAFSAHALGEVDDVERVFRQVHRVLRPGGAFVFSYEHPFSLCVGREGDDTPGGLPLGRLEIRRSYFDASPTTVVRDGETITVHPRATGAVFAALHRAGYRVEILLEPEPVGDATPTPLVPTTIIWRARKQGL